MTTKTDTTRYEQRQYAIYHLRECLFHKSSYQMSKALDKLRPLLPSGVDAFVVESPNPRLVVFVTAEAEHRLPLDLVQLADYVEVQGDLEGGWKAKVLKSREPMGHLPKLLVRPTRKEEFGAKVL